MSRSTSTATLEDTWHDATRTADVSADFTVHRGPFELSVNHTFEGGKVTAVVGRNGSGKTTLSEAIAGFIPETTGTICRGDEVLTDTTSPRPLTVASNLRRTVLLKQRAHLFPTMSVADNVAFGPLAQGLSKQQAADKATYWMDRLELAALQGRRPTSLSGGQQQRVALARALAADPATLLLDEPTSALDVDAAALFRQILSEQLADTPITTILVTHAVEDVVALADEMVVLDEGKIVESGPAQQLLTRPRQPFTASFAGLNRIEGTWDGTYFEAAGITLEGRNFDAQTNRDALVSFSPRALQMDVPAQKGTSETNAVPPNMWRTTVTKVDASQAGFAVTLHNPPGVSAQVDLGMYEGQPFHPGDLVQIRLPKDRVSIYQ